MKAWSCVRVVLAVVVVLGLAAITAMLAETLTYDPAHTAARESTR